ncbi:MAG: (Fe-S)-binding protein [Thermodesulfobacteriota bacterium]|nr:(Fe-S)-binding protein [Thermodesulfobacteriota bacterium]
MFYADRCNQCGDCLVACQWMDVDRSRAIAWQKQMINGESTPVLEQCITCVACNEICPQNANPFDLHLELQEKYRSLVSEEVVEATKDHYLFTGKIKSVPKAKRVLATCTYENAEPELLKGNLFDLPRVGGKPYFCWGLFGHMGGGSIQKEQAQTLVDRLAATGAEEIVCFHVDCYSMLAKVVPDFGITVPFQPIHLAEYLVEYLKDHIYEVNPLNLKVAYQRPCASRYTPDKETFIDEVFELTGAVRVERTYDRKKALCCSSVKLLYNMSDSAADVEKNILDAKSSGAEALVFLCPVCKNMLEGTAGQHGLPMIFLSDIVRMAIGELEPQLKVSA